MKWIKNKIIKWLGIDSIELNLQNLQDTSIKTQNLVTTATTIGVDVHFKEPHMIIIFSKLKGGQIRHISADFKSLSELNSCVKELRDKYSPRDVFWDMPDHMKNLDI